MNQSCDHLEPILNMAFIEGCSIDNVSEGWSEAKRVLELIPGMPLKLREAANSVSSPVEYYRYAGSPHNAADEGFFCSQCMVGLSFPL